MSRAKPDALLAGFSLIEAMAAVALTATIVMGLSSMTGQWLPNWRRGLVDLQRADLLGLGLERLVEDISAAEYVTPWGGAPTPLFEGDSSTAIFVRSAIGPNSYPHLEVIRLAEINDDRGLALTRMRAPFTPTVPAVPAQPFAFGDSVALVRAPFRVSFAYAGPDRVWVESWKSQKRLPDAVRITVRDTIGNQVLAASTAVRIKVSAQGVPKLEAQAKSAEAPPAAAPPSPQAAQPEPQQ
jgi:general secretion pathway protein J